MSTHTSLMDDTDYRRHSGHARHADPQDAEPRADARLRHRAARRADLARRLQGEPRLAAHRAERLERAGWLDAEWRQTENSRRAKFYTLTRAGRKQLEAETADWTRRASAIARLLKAEG